MDMILRPATRSIRSYKFCQSCLQRLQLRCPQSNSTATPLPSSQVRTYRSTQTHNQNASNTQAHPLGDFYADLLAKPIPKSSQAHNTNTNIDLPTFVQTPSTTDLTKEERAAKLFGNIKGSGYERRTSTTPDETWQTVNGVPIPPRPLEPENCCMSGCVHCVWDDYRDDVEEWALRLKQAQAKGGVKKKAAKAQMPRQEVEVASTSMDDDGGGSESLWDTPGQSTDVDGDELFKGIPIGIREFMNVEKKIRERKRERKEKGIVV